MQAHWWGGQPHSPSLAALAEVTEQFVDRSMLCPAQWTGLELRQRLTVRQLFVSSPCEGRQELGLTFSAWHWGHWNLPKNTQWFSGTHQAVFGSRLGPQLHAEGPSSLRISLSIQGMLTFTCLLN